ncbi:MAG TPA: DUF4156 domain-containing protein [Xanthomonadaceae bacterium]|nr:DUF4156 domain-containing protein [Xanthomonadaceae bacterium]
MLLLTVVLAAITGCAWVKLEPDARAIRVAAAEEDLSYCRAAGEIGVSVRDRVGFYDRDRLKVRDELETLARNEARSLGADTIQPLAEPREGEQRFAALACGRSPAATRSPPPRAHDDDRETDQAQTYPIED